MLFPFQIIHTINDVHLNTCVYRNCDFHHYYNIKLGKLNQLIQMTDFSIAMFFFHYRTIIIIVCFIDRPFIVTIFHILTLLQTKSMHWFKQINIYWIYNFTSEKICCGICNANLMLKCELLMTKLYRTIPEFIMATQVINCISTFMVAILSLEICHAQGKNCFYNKPSIETIIFWNQIKVSENVKGVWVSALILRKEQITIFVNK